MLCVYVTYKAKAQEQVIEIPFDKFDLDDEGVNISAGENPKLVDDEYCGESTHWEYLVGDFEYEDPDTGIEYCGDFQGEKVSAMTIDGEECEIVKTEIYDDGSVENCQDEEPPCFFEED